VFWDINKSKAYETFYCKKTLPSDSLYRPDLLYLMLDKVERAQVEKEKLEVKQRNDRKLRKKYFK